MSATGALILALSALLVLGVVAAWLLNLPLWFLAAVLVVGAVILRRVARRLLTQTREGDRERT